MADNDITVVAGRNLTIESAQDTRSESSSHSSRQSGVVGKWTNPAFGKLQSEDSAQSTSTPRPPANWPAAIRPTARSPPNVRIRA